MSSYSESDSDSDLEIERELEKEREYHRVLKVHEKKVKLFRKKGPFTAEAFYDLCSHLSRAGTSMADIEVGSLLDELFHRFPVEELRKIDSMYKSTHNLGKKARKVIRLATARETLVHGRFDEVHLDTLDEDHFEYLCNIVVNDGGDTLFLAYCSGCGKALMTKIMRILWEDRTKHAE